MEKFEGFIDKDITKEALVYKWTRYLLAIMEEYISQRQKSTYSGNSYLLQHSKEMKAIEWFILGLTTDDIRSFRDLIEVVYGPLSKEWDVLIRFNALKNLDHPKVKE